MIAATLVFAFIIIAMAGFIILSAIKAWKYAHLPIHARVELYPVPKEGRIRGAYGGSYFEDTEWWEKPRHTSVVNETLDIIKEMFLIKKLFVHQRSLWWASYALHLGIYVMVAWTMLLLLSVFWHPDFLMIIANILGIAGFTLSTIGCILLLIKRIADSNLRKYTPPQEYFNIALILVVLLTGIYSWVFLASPYVIAQDILSFKVAPLSPLIMVHFVVLGIMFIYIPLSKMSHYVGKFFAFHKVLWDNDPNVAGSEVAKKTKFSAEHPSQTEWSASHTHPAASDVSKG